MPPTTLRIFEVGGFVRDAILGVKSKDRDCSVVIENPPADMTVDQGFEFMRDHLTRQGFKIFVETPEHGTIRALPPTRGEIPADFVLARTEGPYSDGRRPDWVEIGTLDQDLLRRDFTVNALARESDGDIIDIVGGLRDLELMRLRFVGDPHKRIVEDALRIMRGIRFQVTRGFCWEPESLNALHHPDVPALLAGISEERREQELRIMFDRTSSTTVLRTLNNLPAPLVDAMFTGRVRLTSTLRK